MKRRTLILLAFVMVLSLIPVTVMTADASERRRANTAAEARAEARAAASVTTPSAVQVYPGATQRHESALNFLYDTFDDGTPGSIADVLGSSLEAAAQSGISSEGARSILDGLEALASAMGH